MKFENNKKMQLSVLVKSYTFYSIIRDRILIANKKDSNIIYDTFSEYLLEKGVPENYIDKELFDNFLDARPQLKKYAL